MPNKTLPPTQTDIDEAVLDAVDLVQQLGLSQDDGVTRKKAGRSTILLTNISLFTFVFLYINPYVEGWKR